MKQFIRSYLLGIISCIVEFGVFAVLNYLILKQYQNIAFSFGPFNYSILEGGLCAFLSMAISYLIGQIVNFFVQRKFAFEAQEIKSPIRFFLFIFFSLVIYCLVIYIPSIIGSYINNALGYTLGSLISKALSNFIGFIVLFPINKFIIFKKEKD